MLNQKHGADRHGGESDLKTIRVENRFFEGEKRVRTNIELGSRYFNSKYDSKYSGVRLSNPNQMWCVNY